MRIIRSIALTLVTAVPLMAPADSKAEGQPLQDIYWRNTKNCGRNALYIYLHSLGSDVSYSDIIKVIQIGPRGTSLAKLSDASNYFGVASRVRRATPEELLMLRQPAIVHLTGATNEEGHFVVLFNVTEQTVRFIDGTIAVERELSMAEFRKKWSGYLIIPDARTSSPMQIWALCIAAAWQFTLLAILLRKRDGSS